MLLRTASLILVLATTALESLAVEEEILLLLWGRGEVRDEEQNTCDLTIEVCRMSDPTEKKDESERSRSVSFTPRHFSSHAYNKLYVCIFCCA